MMVAFPIFLIGLCARASSNMVQTTLPILGRYVFGLGPFYGGLAISVYNVLGIFGNYVVNPRLSGRTQRRSVLALTAAVAVSSLLLTFSGPVTAVILGGVIGFSFGIIFPSVITTVSLTGGKDGERLLALFTTALTMSLVLGPILESYILTFSYRLVFLFFSFVAAAMFLSSLKVRFATTSKQSLKTTPASRKGVYAGTLVTSVFYLPFAALTAFLPLYAAQVFGTDASASYLSFVPLFAVSVCVRAFMTIRPFKRLRLPILVSILISALGLAAMVYAPSYAAFLVVMAFFGIPHGITYTVSLIVVSRTSAEGERNAAVSLLSAYTNLVYVAVPVVMGYIIERAGIQPAFLLLLVPTVGFSILLLRRYRSQLF
ncbi:MAG: MFS transporter [Nitrososphaerota archaeon]|nr:MFS transporter [Nitrososphaerota archaeon]